MQFGRERMYYQKCNDKLLCDIIVLFGVTFLIGVAVYTVYDKLKMMS